MDFWLNSNGGPKVACETREIMDSLKKSLEKSPEKSRPISAQPATEDPSTSTSPNPDLVTREGLRALLIYRAVLSAAMYATGADVSCVWGTELGRRVVQFL